MSEFVSATFSLLSSIYKLCHVQYNQDYPNTLFMYIF